MGIAFWFGYTIATRERLKLIRQAGFDSVILWWGDDYVEQIGSKAFICKQSRDAGLTIEHVHAPFQFAYALWEDNQLGEEIFRHYIKLIEACRLHQVPVMVMHLTNSSHPTSQYSKGLNRIDYLVDLAEKNNVTLAIENLRDLGSVQRVMAHNSSEHLGICYDAGHHHCYMPSQDLLKDYGARLKALHLHDNDGQADLHLPIGKGDIAWSRVAGKIKETPYQGDYTIEVVDNPLDPLDSGAALTFLRDNHQRLCKTFDKS